MDIKKGDTVWIASNRFGSIYVDSATVKSAGPEVVTLEASSPASGYNVRLSRGRAHPTREAALTTLKRDAEREVEHALGVVDRARGMVAKIEETLRTPAEGTPTP